MDDARSVTMGADERDDFLGTGGTGVISFPAGEDEPPHSVPVSYGYDATEGNFYFRLAFETDSAKRDAPEGPVTFVTYRDTDAGWRSVVAAGTLDEVEETEADEEALEGLRRVHIPLVDVFERDPRETTFRFFRLDPDEFTGRAEAEPTA